MIIIIYNLILLLLFFNFSSCNQYVFVYEHFRHGARGPCNYLDSNGLDYLGVKWETVGELSPIGMRMHYLLGIKNHYKYKDFLSEKFDPREIVIYSTYINRTISSALANLQGFYPYETGPYLLSEDQIKNAIPPNKITEEMQNEIDKLGNKTLPNLINIIPIHIYSIYDHMVLLFDVDNDCEPVAKIRKEILKQEKFKNYSLEFNETFGKNLLKFINKTEEYDKFVNWTYIDIFCDHFIADSIDLTDSSFLDRLEYYEINITNLNEKCGNILAIQNKDVVFGNDDIIIMSQSPHFRMLLNLMENRIELFKQNKSDYLNYNYPKFFIVSGHDTTIGGIQSFMNKVFDTEIIRPKFAANLYFDVEYDDSDNNFYVNYIYNDDVLKKIEFNEFKNKINNVLWSDKKIKKYCKFKYIYYDDDDKNKIIFYIIIGILSLLVIVLSIVIIYLIKKKNKSSFSILNSDKV